MDDAVARHFGLVIAYLLPGFVCLLGVGSVADPVWVWLLGGNAAGPTVSGAVYVMLASIGAGMLASVVRWAVVDTLHEATGLRRPPLDESRLADRLDAYHYLVEQHYRYYQFYSNTLVSFAFAHALWRASKWSATWPWGWPDAGVYFLIIVLAAGSRDALRKYYAGGVLLLGTLSKEVSRDERKAPCESVPAQGRSDRTAQPARGKAGRTRGRRKDKPQADGPSKGIAPSDPNPGDAG